MLNKTEKKPSFSVNENLGVWFDRGLSKGGNIIDFGLAYWEGLSVKEVARKIQEILALNPVTHSINGASNEIKALKFVLNQVKPIGTHSEITKYLKSRGIFAAAKMFLKEVYYFVEDDDGRRRNYYACGWQNEKDAWEVRTKFFKGCIGKKGITCISKNEKKVAVFEGFLDFLSWKMECPDSDHSIIVLNRLSSLQRGINMAKSFSTIDVFFDRDRPGTLATNVFIKELPYASDRSKIYEGFNDYNDKIIFALNKNYAITT